MDIKFLPEGETFFIQIENTKVLVDSLNVLKVNMILLRWPFSTSIGAALGMSIASSLKNEKQTTYCSNW